MSELWFILAAIVSWLLSPLVKKLAIWVNKEQDLFVLEVWANNGKGENK